LSSTVSELAVVPSAFVTTCLLVRIQPLASKMIPDPTPCSGMELPRASVVVPLTRIRTTAGPALAAASMTADDSSILTGT